ncbi:DUF4245 domain-containing protein [Corynebacterium uropygiale]|nr:DUF4245 domain-containing protein [Corynebacterium uropygiale]
MPYLTVTFDRAILTSVAEKPRLFQDGRDMIYSLAAVGVVMILCVGFTGLCSFNPGRPENGPVQAVDDHAMLDGEAHTLGFPIRYVEAPEGWTANSARRINVNNEPAASVGWVTAKDGYVRLVQTGVSAKDAVDGFDGYTREEIGQRSIEGHEAHIFSTMDEDKDNLWVVDLGGVRLLAQGEGSEEDIVEILARAIRTAPLPREDAAEASRGAAES